MTEGENIIKQYLKASLGENSMEKSVDCPSEKVLLDYLEQKLSEYELKTLEGHISGCGFCLSQLSLAYEAESMQGGKTLPRLPEDLVERVKGFVKPGKDNKTFPVAKKRKLKKNLFLAAAIIFFGLSFVIHRYFMQFLAAGLICGFRWAIDSEQARTLIMVIGSWRKHSHDDDDEISERLKDRFSKKDL
ncbi:MAG: hypothetical protein WCY05_00285 [Candidatus Omnitrophota bacterium]